MKVTTQEASGAWATHPHLEILNAPGQNKKTGLTLTVTSKIVSIEKNQSGIWDLSQRLKELFHLPKERSRKNNKSKIGYFS